jgi:hypothetical protein
MSQSGVQLGQFQAPFSFRIEIPARDGFVQEPFSFAVVIWTVHSVLFGRRSIHPWPAPEAYADLTRSRRQRFRVRVRGGCHRLRSSASGLGTIFRGRQLARVSPTTRPGPACWQAGRLKEVIAKRVWSSCWFTSEPTAASSVQPIFGGTTDIHVKILARGLGL